MSGKRQNKTQRLGSSRRNVPRSRNRDTEEKENDTDLPQSRNEESKTRQKEIHTISEKESADASSLLQSGQETSYISKQTSASEQDLLGQAEAVSKKKKMGSTRKSNRAFKGGGIPEEELEHEVKVSEEISEECEVIEEVSVKEQERKEDYNQPGLSDYSSSSSPQWKHSALGSTVNKEENDECHNLGRTFQSQRIGLSSYELNQTKGAAFSKELTSHSFDFNVVISTESKLPHQECDNSLQMYHQMETLPNITGHKWKQGTANRPLIGNWKENRDSEEPCLKETVSKIPNQSLTVYEEEIKVISANAVLQDTQSESTMFDQSCVHSTCKNKPKENDIVSSYGFRAEAKAEVTEGTSTSFLNEYEQEGSNSPDDRFDLSRDQTELTRGERLNTLANVTETTGEVSEQYLLHKDDVLKLNEDAELKSSEYKEGTEEYEEFDMVGDRKACEDVVEAKYLIQSMEPDKNQEHGASADQHVSFELELACDSSDNEIKHLEDKQCALSGAKLLTELSGVDEKEDQKTTEKKEAENDAMASLNPLLFSTTTKMVVETLFEIECVEKDNSIQAYNLPHNISGELSSELDIQTKDGASTDLHLPDSKLYQNEGGFQTNDYRVEKDKERENRTTVFCKEIKPPKNIEVTKVLSIEEEEDNTDYAVVNDKTVLTTRTDISSEEGVLVCDSLDGMKEVSSEKVLSTHHIIEPAEDLQLSLEEKLKPKGECSKEVIEEDIQYEPYRDTAAKMVILQTFSGLVKKDEIIQDDAKVPGQEYASQTHEDDPTTLHLSEKQFKTVQHAEITRSLVTSSDYELSNVLHTGIECLVSIDRSLSQTGQDQVHQVSSEYSNIKNMESQCSTLRTNRDDMMEDRVYVDATYKMTEIVQEDNETIDMCDCKGNEKINEARQAELAVLGGERQGTVINTNVCGGMPKAPTICSNPVEYLIDTDVLKVQKTSGGTVETMKNEEESIVEGKKDAYFENQQNISVSKLAQVTISECDEIVAVVTKDNDQMLTSVEPKGTVESGSLPDLKEILCHPSGHHWQKEVNTQIQSKEIREEINAGPTEEKYVHSGLSSQTTELVLTTNILSSPVTELSDSKYDNANSKENVDMRTTELQVQSQSKKKKRYGSTRRPQGGPKPGSKGEERRWKTVEAEEGTEHEDEDLCSIETTNQTLTESKDETQVSEMIETPTVAMTDADVVHQIDSVILDDVSKADRQVVIIEQHKTLENHKRDDISTTSEEQTTQAVTTKSQDDAFTKHDSVQEASMAAKECDMEYTGEAQHNLDIPMNTHELVFGQLRERSMKDNISKANLDQPVNKESKAGLHENKSSLIQITESKTSEGNVTKENSDFSTSGKRKKMGSTRRGHREQLHGHKVTVEEMNEEENTNEQKFEENTPATEETNSKAEKLSFIPAFYTETSQQAIEKTSELSKPICILKPEHKSSGGVSKIELEGTENMATRAEETIAMDEANSATEHDILCHSDLKLPVAEDPAEQSSSQYFILTCSEEQVCSDLSSQTNKLSLTTNTLSSPELEPTESMDDEGNSKENVEMRNTELHAQSQVKKMRKIGSTRRPQGRQKTDAEVEEQKWEDMEATEGTECVKEERCSNETPHQIVTSNLLTEPQSAVSEVSLGIPDQTLEKEFMELKVETGGCGMSDNSSIIFTDNGQHIDNELSKAETESLEQYENSEVEKEKAYESIPSDEWKMPTDTFTYHTSAPEPPMTVKVCKMENGRHSQAHASPTSGTIEFLPETQDSLDIPINQENTCEIVTDETTQLPLDHCKSEDPVVQRAFKELETDLPESASLLIPIPESKTSEGNVTKENSDFSTSGKRKKMGSTRRGHREQLHGHKVTVEETNEEENTNEQKFEQNTAATKEANSEAEKLSFIPAFYTETSQQAVEKTSESSEPMAIMKPEHESTGGDTKIKLEVTENMPATAEETIATEDAKSTTDNDILCHTDFKLPVAEDPAEESTSQDFILTCSEEQVHSDSSSQTNELSLTTNTLLSPELEPTESNDDEGNSKENVELENTELHAPTSTHRPQERQKPDAEVEEQKWEDIEATEGTECVREERCSNEALHQIVTTNVLTEPQSAVSEVSLGILKPTLEEQFMDLKDETGGSGVTDDTSIIVQPTFKESETELPERTTLFIPIQELKTPEGNVTKENSDFSTSGKRKKMGSTRRGHREQLHGHKVTVEEMNEEENTNEQTFEENTPATEETNSEAEKLSFIPAFYTETSQQAIEKTSELSKPICILKPEHESSGGVSKIELEGTENMATRAEETITMEKANLATEHDILCHSDLKLPVAEDPAELSSNQDFILTCSEEQVCSDLSSQTNKLSLTTNTLSSPELEPTESKDDEGNSKENVEMRNTELHAQSQVKKRRKIGSTRRPQGRQKTDAEVEEQKWEDMEATEGTECVREEKCSNEAPHQIVTSNLLTEPQSAVSEVSLGIPDQTLEKEFMELKVETGGCGMSDNSSIIFTDNGQHIDNELSKAETESLEQYENSEVEKEKAYESIPSDEWKMPTDTFTSHTSAPEPPMTVKVCKMENGRHSQAHASPTSGTIEFLPETQDSLDIPINQENTCEIVTDETTQLPLDHCKSVDPVVQPAFKELETDLPESTSLFIPIPESKTSEGNVTKENSNFSTSGKRKKMGSTRRGHREQLHGHKVTVEETNEEENTNEQKFEQNTAATKEAISEAEKLSFIPAFYTETSQQAVEKTSESSEPMAIMKPEHESTEADTKIKLEVTENMPTTAEETIATEDAKSTTDNDILCHTDFKLPVAEDPAEESTSQDFILTCSEEQVHLDSSSQTNELSLTTNTLLSPELEPTESKDDEGNSKENVELENTELHAPTSTHRPQERQKPDAEVEEQKWEDMEATEGTECVREERCSNEALHQIVTTNVLTEPQSAVSEVSLGILKPTLKEQLMYLKDETGGSGVTDDSSIIVQPTFKESETELPERTTLFIPIQELKTPEGNVTKENSDFSTSGKRKKMGSTRRGHREQLHGHKVTVEEMNEEENTNEQKFEENTPATEETNSEAEKLSFIPAFYTETSQQAIEKTSELSKPICILKPEHESSGGVSKIELEGTENMATTAEETITMEEANSATEHDILCHSDLKLPVAEDPAELSSNQDFILTCSEEQVCSDLSSQTNKLSLTTNTLSSPELEPTESNDDEGNSKENVEMRNTELHAQSQVKKMRKIGSTRRHRERQKTDAEVEEQKWEDMEATEGTECVKEERCSNETPHQIVTSNLLTEPQSAVSEVSLGIPDQTLEKEFMELKVETGGCGMSDNSSIIFTDNGQHIDNELSKAETESLEQYENSEVEKEKAYESIPSDEWKMPTDTFTYHTSAPEPPMTVKVCKMENGRHSQAHASPTSGTIEFLPETQDSLDIPINQENTCEIVTDETTQLPLDHCKSEDPVVQRAFKELETDLPESASLLIPIPESKTSEGNVTKENSDFSTSGKRKKMGSTRRGHREQLHGHKVTVEETNEEENTNEQKFEQNTAATKEANSEAEKLSFIPAFYTETSQQAVEKTSESSEPMAIMKPEHESTGGDTKIKLEVTENMPATAEETIATEDAKSTTDNDILCHTDFKLPVAEDPAEESTSQDFILTCSEEQVHSDSSSQTNELSLTTNTLLSPELEPTESNDDEGNSKENVELENTELHAPTSTHRPQERQKPDAEVEEQKWEDIEATEGTECVREERCSNEALHQIVTTNVLTEPQSAVSEVSLGILKPTLEEQFMDLKDETGGSGVTDDTSIIVQPTFKESETELPERTTLFIPIQELKTPEGNVTKENSDFSTSGKRKKMGSTRRGHREQLHGHKVTVEEMNEEENTNEQTFEENTPATEETNSEAEKLSFIPAFYTETSQQAIEKTSELSKPICILKPEHESSGGVSKIELEGTENMATRAEETITMEKANLATEHDILCHSDLKLPVAEDPAELSSNQDFILTCSEEQVCSDLSSQTNKLSLTTNTLSSPELEPTESKDDEGNSKENVEMRNTELHAQSQVKKRRKIGSTRRPQGRQKTDAEVEEQKWEDMEATEGTECVREEKCSNEAPHQIVTSNLLTEPQSAVSEVSLGIPDQTLEKEFMELKVETGGCGMSDNSSIIFTDNGQHIDNELSKAETESLEQYENSEVEKEKAYESIPSDEWKMPTDTFTSHTSAPEPPMTVKVCKMENGRHSQAHASPTSGTIEFLPETQDSLDIPINQENTCEIVTDETTQLPLDHCKSVDPVVQPAFKELETDLPESTSLFIPIPESKTSEGNVTKENSNFSTSGKRKKMGSTRRGHREQLHGHKVTVEETNEEENTNEQKFEQNTAATKEAISEAEKLSFIPAFYTETSQQAVEKTSESSEPMAIMKPEHESTEADTKIKLEVTENMPTTAEETIATEDAKSTTDNDILCHTDFKLPVAEDPAEESTSQDFILTCSEEQVHLDSSSQTNELSLTTNTLLSPELEPTESKDDEGNSKENVELENTELHAPTSTHRPQERQKPDAEVEEQKWEDMEATEGTECVREERCSNEALHQIVTTNVLTEPQSAVSEVSLGILKPTLKEQLMYLKDETGGSGVTDDSSIIVQPTFKESETELPERTTLFIPIQELKTPEGNVTKENSDFSTSGKRKKMGSTRRGHREQLHGHKVTVEEMNEEENTNEQKFEENTPATEETNSEAEKLSFIPAFYTETSQQAIEKTSELSKPICILKPEHESSGGVSKIELEGTENMATTAEETITMEEANSATEHDILCHSDLKLPVAEDPAELSSNQDFILTCSEEQVCSDLSSQTNKLSLTTNTLSSPELEPTESNDDEGNSKENVEMRNTELHAQSQVKKMRKIGSTRRHRERQKTDAEVEEQKWEDTEATEGTECVKEERCSNEAPHQIVTSNLLTEPQSAVSEVSLGIPDQTLEKEFMELKVETGGCGMSDNSSIIFTDNGQHIDNELSKAETESLEQYENSEVEKEKAYESIPSDEWKMPTDTFTSHTSAPEPPMTVKVCKMENGRHSQAHASPTSGTIEFLPETQGSLDIPINQENTFEIVTDETTQLPLDHCKSEDPVVQRAFKELETDLPESASLFIPIPESKTSEGNVTKENSDFSTSGKRKKMGSTRRGHREQLHGHKVTVEETNEEENTNEQKFEQNTAATEEANSEAEKLSFIPAFYTETSQQAIEKTSESSEPLAIMKPEHESTGGETKIELEVTENMPTTAEETIATEEAKSTTDNDILCHTDFKLPVAEDPAEESTSQDFILTCSEEQVHSDSSSQTNELSLTTNTLSSPELEPTESNDDEGNSKENVKLENTELHAQSQVKKRRKIGSTRRHQGRQKPDAEVEEQKWEDMEATEGTECVREEKCSNEAPHQTVTTNLLTEPQSVVSEVSLGILEPTLEKQFINSNDETGGSGMTDIPPIKLADYVYHTDNEVVTAEMENLEQYENSEVENEKGIEPMSSYEGKMPNVITEYHYDTFTYHTSSQEAPIVAEECHMGNTENGRHSQLLSSPTSGTMELLSETQDSLDIPINQKNICKIETETDETKQLPLDHCKSEDHVVQSAFKESERDLPESASLFIPIQGSKTPEGNVTKKNSDFSTSGKRKKMGSTRRGHREQLHGHKVTVEEINEEENTNEQKFEENTSATEETNSEAEKLSFIPAFYTETSQQAIEKTSELSKPMAIIKPEHESTEGDTKIELEITENMPATAEETIATEEAKSTTDNDILCHTDFKLPVVEDPAEESTTQDFILTCTEEQVHSDSSSQTNELSLTTNTLSSPELEPTESNDDEGNSKENVELKNTELHAQSQVKKIRKIGSTRRHQGRQKPDAEVEEQKWEDMEATEGTECVREEKCSNEAPHQIVTTNVLTEPQSVVSEVSLGILEPTLEKQFIDSKDETGGSGMTDIPPIKLADYVHHTDNEVVTAEMENLEQYENSEVENEKGIEPMSSYEEKMPNVITEYHYDTFTYHTSSQEAPIVAEECHMGNTENGRHSQLLSSRTSGTMELLSETQDSLDIPINQKNICKIETETDVTKQLPLDNCKSEDPVVQSAFKESETDLPESASLFIPIQGSKTPEGNVTKKNSDFSTSGKRKKMGSTRRGHREQLHGHKVTVEETNEEENTNEQKFEENTSATEETNSEAEKLSFIPAFYTETSEQAIEKTSESSEPMAIIKPEHESSGGDTKIQLEVTENSQDIGNQLSKAETESKMENESHSQAHASPTSDTMEQDSLDIPINQENTSEIVSDETRQLPLDHCKSEDPLVQPAFKESEKEIHESESLLVPIQASKTPEGNVTKENSDFSTSGKRRKMGSTRRGHREQLHGHKVTVEETNEEENTNEQKFEENTSATEETNLHSETVSFISAFDDETSHQPIERSSEPSEPIDITTYHGDTFTTHTSPHEASITVKEINIELIENESQVHASHTSGTLELIPETQHSLHIPVDRENTFELESDKTKQMSLELLESTSPLIQIQESKTTEGNITRKSDCNTSGKKRKIGSTRRGHREQLYGHNLTGEEMNEEENTKEQKFEENTSATEETNSEAEKLSFIPVVDTKIFHQATEKISEPSEPTDVLRPELEKVDKKNRRIGSTRKNLKGGDRKITWKDTEHRDTGAEEDLATVETKLPATKDKVLHETASGFSVTAETGGLKDEPQTSDIRNQSEDSLLREIECELKKSGQSQMNITHFSNNELIFEDLLNSPLETANNLSNISEISEPVVEQNKSSLELPSSQSSQTSNEPSSTERRRRKMGSTRKTCQKKYTEETEQEADNLEKDELGTVMTKDTVILQITETTKASVDNTSKVQAVSQVDENRSEETSSGGKRKFGSRRAAKGSRNLSMLPSDEYEPYQKKTDDLQVHTDELMICDPYFIPRPESNQPASDHNNMEASLGNKRDEKPVVSEADATARPALVSLDDLRMPAAFNGNTGKREKIDFERWNELPDFEIAGYNVVMVGNCSVGKTSFIKRFQSGHFFPDYSSTIGVDTCVQIISLGNRTVKLTVWDTAGQERYQSITRQVFHKAQGLLLMYDITSSQSFCAVRNWISQIQENAPPDVIILLLGNKKDCAEREVELQEGEDLSREYDIHFLECSAATGENVAESLKTLAWLLVKQNVRREEDHAILQQQQPQKKSGCC